MEGANGESLRVTPPNPETVRAFLNAKTSDASITCPGFQEAARRLGSAHLRLHQARKRGHTWVAVLNPVVSPSHAEALVWIEQYSGRLAGGTVLVLLRKTSSDNWQVAGMLVTSVS
jgi:hypothetical protein